MLRQTDSDCLRNRLICALEPEDLHELYLGTRHDSKNLGLRFFSLYDDRIEEVWKLCDPATKDEFDSWMSEMQATGQSPEVKYRMVNAEQPDIMPIRGLEDFTNTQAVDEEANPLVSQMTASLGLRQEKISVGLERQIDLPSHTEVVDSVERVSGVKLDMN